jgi:hypothetical protein
MKGEPLELDEEEQKSFAAIAYAFRYYQQLNRGIEFDRFSTLSEVIRLVNFELREDPEQARHLVNGWFDNHRNAVHGRGSQERHRRPPGPEQRL